MPEIDNNPLGPGAVQVWFATPDCPANRVDSETSEQLEILSPLEQQRYSAFRFDNDRGHYLLAHALLRHTLSRFVGSEPQDLQFGCNPYGKPFLKEPTCLPPVEFNLTHTRGLIACAFSLHPVGLDAESLEQTLDMKIAPLAFSPPEIADLKRQPGIGRTQRILEYWTLKEAFIKATGNGLSQPLDRFWFELDRSGAPNIDFAPGEPYRPDQWQFAQLKGVSPTHEMAVAVELPPGLKLSLDVIQFKWQCRKHSTIEAVTGQGFP